MPSQPLVRLIASVASQIERFGYCPDELIAIAARQGADFYPGTYWSYSNTGYVMLAQIAEEIDGKPFSEVVRNRLLTPLNLTQTQALRHSQRKSSRGL